MYVYRLIGMHALYMIKMQPIMFLENEWQEIIGRISCIFLSGSQPMPRSISIDICAYFTHNRLIKNNRLIFQ